MIKTVFYFRFCTKRLIANLQFEQLTDGFRTMIYLNYLTLPTIIVYIFIAGHGKWPLKKRTTSSPTTDPPTSHHPVSTPTIQMQIPCLMLVVFLKRSFSPLLTYSKGRNFNSFLVISNKKIPKFFWSNHVSCTVHVNIYSQVFCLRLIEVI